MRKETSVDVANIILPTKNALAGGVTVSSLVHLGLSLVKI